MITIEAKRISDKEIKTSISVDCDEHTFMQSIGTINHSMLQTIMRVTGCGRFKAMCIMIRQTYKACTNMKIRSKIGDGDDRT